jgi:hypothetical protein
MRAPRGAVYRRGRAAQSMATGWHILKFVTPGDVDDFRNRLDPMITALDGTVQTCAALPQAVRDGWAKWLAGWKTFLAEESSWLHTLAQYETTEAYEQDLAHWQDMIAKATCGLPTPRVKPGDNEGALPSDDTTSTIKWVAIAGVAIAAVVGIKAVMR